MLQISTDAGTNTGLPLRRVARVRVSPSKRLLAARHPSLHLPHLTAGPNRKPLPISAQAPTAPTPGNAYAECGRLRGRLRRATQISSVSWDLAAHQAKTAQPVGGVGLMARNLDAPEGI